MMRATLVVLTLATIAILGSRPAQASYYNGPWCAVFTLGPGGASERCDYPNLESCRQDIIAGNRGFCRQNGYYLWGQQNGWRGRNGRRQGSW